MSPPVRDASQKRCNPAEIPHFGELGKVKRGASATAHSHTWTAPVRKRTHCGASATAPRPVLITPPPIPLQEKNRF